MKFHYYKSRQGEHNYDFNAVAVAFFYRIYVSDCAVYGAVRIPVCTVFPVFLSKNDSDYRSAYFGNINSLHPYLHIYYISANVQSVTHTNCQYRFFMLSCCMRFLVFSCCQNNLRKKSFYVLFYTDQRNADRVHS